MAASIRQILAILDDWDPIGIRNAAGASHEYDSYALPIYRLLREGDLEDVILDYLRWMTEHMGLPASRKTLRPIATKILRIDVSHDESFE